VNCGEVEGRDTLEIKQEEDFRVNCGEIEGRDTLENK